MMIYTPHRPKVSERFEMAYVESQKRWNGLPADSEGGEYGDTGFRSRRQNEWKPEKRSWNKLVTYLEGKKQSLKVLQIGSDKGPPAHELSKMAGMKMIVVDINFSELEPVSRLFSHPLDLGFIYDDIRSEIFSDLKFDIVVFLASIQYFPCVRQMVDAVLEQLNPGGEIHVVGTKFYTSRDAIRPGSPGTAGYGFRHGLHEFYPYPHRLLYNPLSVRNKLFRNTDPFPWVCIKNG
jgi:hypothetical protein